MTSTNCMKALCLAGRIILENGGETYRVEETITRMGRSFGFTEVESFAVPSGIFISYRKSERVVFADGFAYSSLPAQFKKVTVEPKKTEIKDYLKTGATIEGVELIESSNIQIR